MRLTLHGMGASRTILARNPQGKSLYALLGTHASAVDLVQLQGGALLEWPAYVPRDGDDIAVWMRPGFGVVEAALLALGPIWGPALLGLATSLVVYGVTYGLQLLLTNRPDPTQEHKNRPEETFGIAGITNTVALGTPKFLSYGRQRVFGHIIGSQIDVTPDLRRMTFGALYYMGEGEVSRIYNVEINDIPLSQYPGTTFETRRGTASQTVMKNWKRVRQVYNDGRALPTIKSGTSLVYQTKGSAVKEVFLILALPHLYVPSGTGLSAGTVNVDVNYKRIADSQWHSSSELNIFIKTTASSAFFWQHTISFPEADQWQLQFTLDDLVNHGEAVPSLYNVEERTDLELRYPHSALLALAGASSAQVTSLEGMQVSALVDGRKVKVWNGATFQVGWTRNRVWIVRDMLTDPRAGMGHRFPSSLWNDDAALSAAQYYNATISGEVRDYCDLLVNQRRPIQDHLREVLTEGNAALIPSDGQVKYVVDKPQTPRLLYAAPGNIAPGSLTTTLGAQGPVPNTVRGEFRDAAHAYRLQVLEGTADDINGALVHEATVALKTITRESQATRALTYALNKSRKVVRRYTWQSPIGAMVSEPFDAVMLSYETPRRRHGWSGFLQSGTTTLRLVLDQLVDLVAGQTYEVIVKFQHVNIVATRTFIASFTRPEATVSLAPALGGQPSAGDLYAIGVLGQSLVPVLIEQVQLGDNDTYTLVGSEYRSDVYDTSGLGLTPKTATAFYPLPALFAEDTLPRYHASFSPAPPETRVVATEPWPGAALYRTEDEANTVYALSSRGAAQPVAGVLTTALAAAPAQLSDYTTVFEVDVTGGLLTTITMAELQMGYNLLMVGHELLHFRIATSLGSGTTPGSRRYRLSHLLRGRRGTEWAIGTQGAGAPVVLMGSGVFTRDILLAERHRVRSWKSPTEGEDLVEATPQDYAVPSENLRPWTPGTPRARYLTDGSWFLSWYGRARFLGDWEDGTQAVPDYDFLHYVVTIYSNVTRSVVVHRREVFQGGDLQQEQQYLYSAAQQLTDFGSLQATLYWNVQSQGEDDLSHPLALVGTERGYVVAETPGTASPFWAWRA